MVEVFGWLGATRRQRIAMELCGDLGDWSKAWRGAGLDAVVMGTDVPGSGVSHCFRMGPVCVGLDRTPAALAAWLANRTVATNALSEYLGQAAIKALLLCVAPGTRADVEPVDWLALPRNMKEPRFGGLHLEIRLEDLRLTLTLEREVLDARWPAIPRPRTARLEPRKAAADTLATSLRVELDLGELAVAEAQLLAPGDILQTRTPLSQLAGVLVGDRPLPGVDARLGRVDAHRAVAIETPGSIGDLS